MMYNYELIKGLMKETENLMVDVVDYKDETIKALVKETKVKTVASRVTNYANFKNALYGVRMNLVPGTIYKKIVKDGALVQVTEGYSNMLILGDIVSHYDFIINYYCLGWNIMIPLNTKVLTFKAPTELAQRFRRAYAMKDPRQIAKGITQVSKTIPNEFYRLVMSEETDRKELRYDSVDAEQYSPNREQLEDLAEEYGAALGWHFSGPIRRRDGDHLRDRMLSRFDCVWDTKEKIIGNKTILERIPDTERITGGFLLKEYDGSFYTQNQTTGEVKDAPIATTKLIEHSPVNAYKKLLGVPMSELLEFYEFLCAVDDFIDMTEVLEPGYIFCPTCGHVHRLASRDTAQPTFILDGCKDSDGDSEMQDYENEYGTRKDSKAYNKFMDEDGYTYCRHCNAEWIFEQQVSQGYVELFPAETEEVEAETIAQ